MRVYKLGVLTLLIFTNSIFFCSCWNYREIDTMAIASAIAVDKNELTNSYIVTLEVLIIQSQGTSTKIGSEIYTTEGPSIFEAIRVTIEKTGLRVYWSDAKVIIISEKIAREGVIPVIDWVSRDSELRPDMWMLISKGNSAAEIMDIDVKLNEVVGFHLDDTMKSQSVVSKYPETTVWKFIQSIDTKEKEKSVAVATVKKEAINSKVGSLISGSAIFKSDKLQGFLNENETLYMLMLRNKIKKGLITLKKVGQSDTDITFEIFSNKTKLTPTYNNGKASMIIDVYPVVGIAEVGGSKDFMNEENLKILQSETEKKLETDLQHLIRKLQKEYKSDVIDFEQIFDEKKPKESKELKKSGKDIFDSMNTEVKVHLNIRESGRTTKPIHKGQK